MKARPEAIITFKRTFVNHPYQKAGYSLYMFYEKSYKIENIVCALTHMFLSFKNSQIVLTSRISSDR